MFLLSQLAVLKISWVLSFDNNLSTKKMKRKIAQMQIFWVFLAEHL